MVDEGVYTKSADIQALAGINAGTNAKLNTTTDIYVLNVEGAINAETYNDWSALWTAGSLDASLKLALTMAGASRCAMIVVNADPTGYSARERETTLDLLNSLYASAMRTLKDTDSAALIRKES